MELKLRAAGEVTVIVLAALLAYSGAFKIAALDLFRASWVPPTRFIRRLLTALPFVELLVGFTFAFSPAVRLLGAALFIVLAGGRLALVPATTACRCGMPGLARRSRAGGTIYVGALGLVSLASATMPNTRHPILSLSITTAFSGLSWALVTVAKSDVLPYPRPAH